MEIKYTAIVVATVLQFVLGAIWYSPLLFGKLWMKIMEVENKSKEEMNKMQKEMIPFYALQFVLTLWTTFHLSRLILVVPGISIYGLAFWLWLAFMLPLTISSVIWANTKKKYWAKQVMVMSGMQLVGILLAAFILSNF